MISLNSKELHPSDQNLLLRLNDKLLTQKIKQLGTNIRDTGFNVKAHPYNAKGDGVTDDRLAIQAAADAVYAQGGGTVFFPPGTYILSTPSASLGGLIYKDNVNFVGSGRGVTILKLKASQALTGAHGFIEPYNNVVALPASGHYTKNNYFAHFSIDGNYANQTAGHVYEGLDNSFCKNVVIEDVEAYSCGETGFHAQVSNVGTDQSADISFNGCFAYNNQSDGFQVGGVSMVNCYAYDNGGAGITSVGNYVSGNVDKIITRITNCSATGNAQGGILSVLQQAPPIHTLISNCSAIGNRGNGMGAIMNYTSIDNCNVSYNEQDGIDVQADYVNISNTKSYNNYQSPFGGANFASGIKITGSRKYVTIIGCTCTDEQPSNGSVTVVDYSLIDSGVDTITLTHTLGVAPFTVTSLVGTEGPQDATHWDAATSNAVTATNIGIWANQLGVSVSAKVFESVVRISATVRGDTLAVATSMAAAEGTVTTGITKTQNSSLAFTAPGSGSNNLLTNCSLNGNVTTTPYQIGSATDWLITDNLGYNPIGAFVGGGGNNPANPAVPATTVTKTNTYGYPCLVSIAAGTVTGIAIGGTATGLITGSFILQPNQTIAITYAVAPTWQWFGL